MVSKEMERFLSQARTMKEARTEVSVELSRAGMEQWSTVFTPPLGARFQARDIDGVPGEWSGTSETNMDHVVLYFHGGGYVAGSINSHRGCGAWISQASKARVLIIDYRLAPEHPFPAALDDAMKVYHWLTTNQRILPEDLVIAGDSAGGGLALAVLLKLRDEQTALPAAAVCLSPWTDLALSGQSLVEKAEIDVIVSLEALEKFSKFYLKDTDPTHPLASPLYADLQGLPPLFIQVGTAEIILDDSLRFAERAKAAGVEVTLDVWEDMPHIFALFAAITPEGKEGVQRIGYFIQQQFK
jgi:monoterpene epsilon-lactone hydrolase